MRYVLLFFIFTTAACLSARAANLGEIYKLARDNDVQYAAAREAYRAGLESLEQVKALYRPSITATANIRANKDYSSFTEERRHFGSKGITLSAVQPLWRQQNVQSYEQGVLQAELAKQQLRQAEQELLLRVATAYFDVLLAQDALATVRAQKNTFSQQLAQTRKSFEVGTVPITDVHEAQARFDLTTAQEIAAINDLEVRRRTIERIINRKSPHLARLNEQVNVAAGTESEMTKFVERASIDSVAVEISLINQELAKREAIKQRVGRRPTFDLTASASSDRSVTSAGTTIQTDIRQSAIGIEMSWPLYEGGAISSRQREAVANLARAGFELDNARRLSAFEAREAYLGALSGASLQKALTQALVSSESQVKSTRRGFEVGVRTRLDVLDAEQQQYTTKRDLASARYQTLLAGLQLRAAANALSEQDIFALDKLLR